MAETHHDKPQTTQTHFQLRDKHVCILLAAILVVLGAFAYQSYQDWQAEVEEANRQTQIFFVWRAQDKQLRPNPEMYRRC